MVTPDAVDVAMTTGDRGPVVPLLSWSTSPARMPGPGEESAAGVGPERSSEAWSDISRSEARSWAHNLRERDLGRSLSAVSLAHSLGAGGCAGAACASHPCRRHCWIQR